MKKSLLVFVVLFSLLLPSCARKGKLSAEEITAINAQETYADAPFSLVDHFSSLDELYDFAEVVVDCTVKSTESVLLDGFPQTHSTVAVHQVLKGTAPDTLTVIEEGGNDRTGKRVYLGVPPMEEGNRYILFLVDSGLSQYENSWCVAGAFQGKFIVQEGYVFQQATEGVKLSNEVYDPVEREEFYRLLPKIAAE